MNPLLNPNQVSPESRIRAKLEDAWKDFAELPEAEERDLMEFKVAIKHAEHVLLMRTSRQILQRCVTKAVQEDRKL